jgi:hypothetical protein
MAGDDDGIWDQRKKREHRKNEKGATVRLLLDCHIPKSTLSAVRQISPHDIEHLAVWREGLFLKASDEEILTACHSERRVFVTFDLGTIPDLLRVWAGEEKPHSGIFFGDTHIVKVSQPGAIARSMVHLAAELGKMDTANLVRFLK